MAQMTVTPETMNTIAGDIENKISDWNGAVQKIYKLKDEMDAMWDGTANDTFNNMFAEDAPKFNNLAKLMQDYATAIKNAANKYVLGEEEVKGIVSKRL
jgi:WXG100 family type VII secretion target